MEEKQTTEVRQTNDTVGADNVQRKSVRRTTSTPSSVVAARAIWFIAGVIITLLALRIVLLMLAANESAAFVGFVYALSNIFAAPFYGIFNYQPTYGEFTFEISSVIAIAVYALVAWGAVKLLTLNKPHAEV